MKTAILIIGHIRTWEYCKDNFLESFAHLTPDIFVSTYDLKYNYHPAQQGWMNGAIDTYLEYEEIRELFKDLNIIKIDYERIQDVNSEYEIINDQIHNNFKNDISTYLQYRKLTRAVNILKKYETEFQFKYDSIIKLRTDIHYNRFEYDINNTSIIISNGNVYPNDVIFATERDKFISISEFCNNEFYNPIYTDSHLRPPHNLLLRACEYNNLNIQQQSLMQYVVRKTGKHYYTNIN